MKKVNLNFDFKALAGKLLKNLGLLFFGVLVILVILDFFKINDSVQLILKFRKEPEILVTSANKGVRINFEKYNKAVDRIQKSKIFVPSTTTIANPFQQK